MVENLSDVEIMENEYEALVRKRVAEVSTEGLKSKREFNTVMYLRSKILNSDKIYSTQNGPHIRQ
jgi:hypothetical protein